MRNKWVYCLWQNLACSKRLITVTYYNNLLPKLDFYSPLSQYSLCFETYIIFSSFCFCFCFLHVLLPIYDPLVYPSWFLALLPSWLPMFSLFAWYHLLANMLKVTCITSGSRLPSPSRNWGPQHAAMHRHSWGPGPTVTVFCAKLSYSSPLP